MNYSMIFMGMFEEPLLAIAEEMTQAAPKGQVTPAVRAEIESIFSSIREEMSSQWPKEASAFKRYVSNPAFDKGVEVVERHDFGRPRLTEKLSDEVLASYVFLLQSGDKEMGGMFRELAEWRGSLPKAPWSS